MGVLDSAIGLVAFFVPNSGSWIAELRLFAHGSSGLAVAFHPLTLMLNSFVISSAMLYTLELVQVTSTFSCATLVVLADTR
jgi:hypothetical protein